MGGRTKSYIKQKPEPGHWLAASRAAVLLCVINIAVFIWMLTPAGRQYFTELIVYPGNLIKGNYWCLLTGGFVHSSLSHLFFNMLGLLAFGHVVERHLGFWKTVFIYLGALLISMLFSTVVYALILHKNVAIMGASGAVMGLMGAAVLLAPFSVTWEMIVPIPTMFKGWLFLYADLQGFLGGERDGISHLAHLIGFASIVILVYFLTDEDKQRLFAGLVINLVSLALFVWIWQKYFIAT
ncbi:MAG: rhomboid family intramembrane serine protease [Candidatus Omnitrophota bacterium]